MNARTDAQFHLPKLYRFVCENSNTRPIAICLKKLQYTTAEQRVFSTLFLHCLPRDKTYHPKKHLKHPFWPVQYHLIVGKYQHHWFQQSVETDHHRKTLRTVQFVNYNSIGKLASLTQILVLHADLYHFRLPNLPNHNCHPTRYLAKCQIISVIDRTMALLRAVVPDLNDLHPI